MSSKFNQNILQPKRQNTPSEPARIEKGLAPKSATTTSNQNGATLTLNGITIGLPSSVHAINNGAPKKQRSTTMAKRNARERNRVKLVNQGFQTLKQHIPEAFRLKKMSKVDTLKCALEYIRSMEQVLDITPDGDSTGINQGQGCHGSSEHYQGFSQEEINHHLDKICSMEESSNISSLDQSFSSFSENETLSPVHNLSSSSDILAPSLDLQSIKMENNPILHEVSGIDENLARFVSVQNGQGGKGEFDHIIMPVGSRQMSGPHDLILSNGNNGLEGNSMELLVADENYSPANPQAYIQVVEIIRMQQQQ